MQLYDDDMGQHELDTIEVGGRVATSLQIELLWPWQTLVTRYKKAVNEAARQKGLIT